MNKADLWVALRAKDFVISTVMGVAGNRRSCILVTVEKLQSSSTRTSFESTREERASSECAEMWLRSAVLTCSGMCTDERLPTWEALYLKITCFWRRMTKSRALCMICQPVISKEMTSD